MSGIVQLPQDYKTIMPTRKFTNDGGEIDAYNDFKLSGDVWTQGGAMYGLTGTVKEGTLPMSFAAGPYGNVMSTGIVSGSTIHPMTYLNQGGYIDLDEKKLETELSDKLWENEKMIPRVREALIRIANKFRESIGLFVVEDIRVTGSMANYNYNKDSDIDLHLVYDYNNMGINKDILDELFKAKKQIFNGSYDITINNVPVEVGVEDINTPLVSTGVYSLLKDKWIVKPENAGKEVPEFNKQDYDGIVQIIEKAIESKDRQELSSAWDMVKSMRKSSLKKDGEFSQGNLLFKELRNNGFLGRLKDALNSSISEELSIAEMFYNKNKYPKTPIPTTSSVWSLE